MRLYTHDRSEVAWTQAPKVKIGNSVTVSFDGLLQAIRHARREGYRRGLSSTRLDSLMEAFPVSLSKAAITEMSDRTQLLATGRA